MQPGAHLPPLLVRRCARRVWDTNPGGQGVVLHLGQVQVHEVKHLPRLLPHLEEAGEGGRVRCGPELRAAPNRLNLLSHAHLLWSRIPPTRQGRLDGTELERRPARPVVGGAGGDDGDAAARRTRAERARSGLAGSAPGCKLALQGTPGLVRVELQRLVRAAAALGDHVPLHPHSRVVLHAALPHHCHPVLQVQLRAQVLLALPHVYGSLVHLVERLALLNLLNHHVARAFLHHSIGPVRNGSNAHHGCRPGARVLGGVHPDVVQAAVVRRL
mmetsp:Transcript_5052/g.9512  ORF Transcript_5052/g.9512 Transcript_5052/m.9512 type:complete len:272 (+) Transcript_5052:393-1208(+)